MRIAVDVDGKTTEVEVDLAAGTVRIGDRTFPARVFSESPARVEIEIAGERVVVEGWPPGTPTPSEPVAVDGELFRVRTSGVASAREPSAGPVTAPTATAGPAPPGPGTPSGSEGTPIVPPMPGKVVEVRVREGESVVVGQVLLVLEAMKMRNEVTTPVAGVVRSLRVSAGSNVRAREAMLRIAPG